MSQESAYAHAAKIPYGQTLCIDGRVKVTRGRTYFDAKNISFPDGTPVFLWVLQEGEGGQDDNLRSEE
jgi:hypothetical protein